MPRESPFCVVLSKDERQHLESIARQYTSPYCDVIRAKIILLASQGLSNDVIASRLDTPRQIVSKWRKRFCLARLPGLEDEPRGGRRPAFPPSLVVQVKALACELPHRGACPSLASRCRHPAGSPRSGAGSGDQRSHHLALARPDAIRPWRYRSWIFPRDPFFWKGRPDPRSLPRCLARTTPGSSGFVLSADEKPSIQARRRQHSSLPPAPALPARIEHEYERKGAWVYLAAWDVRRAKPSVVAHPGMGSRTLILWSARSWTKSPIARPGVCSGSSIIAPCTAAKVRPATASPLAFDYSGSHSEPCQLAQPSGDLLLRRSAQSSHAQRFPLSGPIGRGATGLPATL